MNDSDSPKESYSHGYGVTPEGLAGRTAQSTAGFLIPYLESGMNLIDCGCGPGSLTVSLAELVAPGKVIGIDIEDSQVQRARKHASERGIENVEFHQATAYELPAEDSSQDAVFSNTVLQHLAEPITALREWNRVLKPGGLLGIREEDWGSLFFWPESPLVKQAYDLYFRFWRSNGGDPYLPRQYRRILREAGFSVVEISGEAQISATDDKVSAVGNYGSTHWLEPHFADTVIERGWVNRVELESLAESFNEWASDEDAFTGLTVVSAAARKPED